MTFTDDDLSGITFRAYLAADEAWSKELQRLFGRNAGDVRYTKEGCTGPTLAPLYAEFARTGDAWRMAMRKVRDDVS